MKNPDVAEHANRLDVEMVARKIARSRSFAADLIKRGKVSINGKIALKPNNDVYLADEITLSLKETFVSRAGEKLAHALDVFNVVPEGIVAIDIGSSTGGFTDCLLQRGAAKVIAVDVGREQFDAVLGSDPRIELHESTDVRNFSLPSPVDLGVVDVSFISLETILPKIFEFIKKGGSAVVLVKPQFEVGKEIADKYRGVIVDPTEQSNAVWKIKKIAKSIGFQVVSETPSPIEGEKGNREFFLCLTKPVK